jgi:hypothetical protein
MQPADPAEQVHMTQVSRPLLAALVAAILFLAVWFVALKPSSSPSSGGAAAPAAQLPGVAGLGHAVAKAHGAVSTAAAANAAASGEAPAASAAAPAATASTHPVTKPAPAPTSVAAPANAAARRAAVDRALTRHQVVALLFYNPAGYDDRAIKRELASVPAHASSVYKLMVPLGELSSYPAITNQVQVQTSPTLVIVDRSRQATTLVGFADRFEITQRLAAALAVR